MENGVVFGKSSKVELGDVDASEVVDIDGVGLLR